MSSNRIRRFLFSSLKVLSWFLGSIIALMLLLIVIVRIPYVQDIITSKIENVIKKDLDTEFTIGKAYLNFPKKIELKSLYLEDLQGDTLVYFKSLEVDADLWQLAHKKIELNTIELKGLVAYVLRKEKIDSFNFQFILNSFISDNTIKDTPSEPWDFSAENVIINNLNIAYSDAYVGMWMEAQWENLELKIDELDLSKSQINLESIYLNKADISYRMEPRNTIEDSVKSTESAFYFNLEDFKIDNSAFYFDDTDQQIRANIGALDINSNNLNFNEYLIDLDQVRLDNSKLSYRNLSSQDSTSTTPATSKTSSPWQVNINKILFENDELMVVLDSTVANSQSFNPSNFKLQKLKLDINAVKYDSNDIQGLIEELSFGTGEQELKLKAQLSISDTAMSVQSFDLLLNESNIKANLMAKYEALNTIIKDDTKLEIVVEPSEIYTSDISYFVPDLPTSKIPESIQFQSEISGTLASIDISDFKAQTQYTTLSMDGLLNKVMETDSITYSLNSFELISDQRELNPYLPDSLNQSIQLPDTLILEAKGYGSLKKYQGELNLTSSYGSVHFDSLTVDARDSIPEFFGSLKSNGLDIGHLLRMENDLNGLNFGVILSGSGNDIENINGSLNGYLQSINYNNYSYERFELEASLKELLLDFKAGLKDENVSFSLDGYASLSPDDHNNRIRLDLKEADLYRTNFSRVPLSVKGKLISQLSTDDFRNFKGKIALNNIEIDKGEDIVMMDSLVITSKEDLEAVHVNIESDVLEADFKSNTDLFTSTDKLKKHLTQSLELVNDSASVTEDVWFNFDLMFKKTELITDVLVPDISEFKPGIVQVKFSSEQSTLDTKVQLHKLIYGSTTIDSLDISSKTTNGSLSSQLSIKKVSNDNIVIRNIGLNNLLKEKRMRTSLSILDSTNRPRYRIETLLEREDSSYLITLDNNSFLLDYKKWDINQKSPLVLGSSKSSGSSLLSLEREEQVLYFESNPTTSSLAIGFDKFRLSTFSEAISNNETLIEGKVNGEINLDYGQNGTLLSDMTISQLEVLGSTLGDLSIKLDQLPDRTYKSLIALKSKKNDIRLEGHTNSNSPEKTALVAEIDKLDLSTLSPIFEKSVTNLSGTFKGKLSINNLFESPDANGRLAFDNVNFRPLALNNQFKLKNELITTDNSIIRFEEFSIENQLNNTATINGTAKLLDLSFYELDLNLETKDFLIIDTQAEDNDLFYGKLVTDGTIDVSGTSARPKVDMKLTLSDESNLTYIVPESEYNTISTENTVQFISKEEIKNEKMPVGISDSTRFEGVDLTASLEINNGAQFIVIIDPKTQDQLKVKGSATLNLDLSRKGDIKINGRYIVEEGSYNFSFYKLLKRTFELEKGSTIEWSGEPYEAQLSMKAYNKVIAAPIDLMINQISGANPQQLNQYKQRIPFLVYLDIDGELTAPDISFKIDMPEEERGAFGGSVYARIIDLNTRESDLNKQVFALLLLERFISDDPLQSEGGYDVEDRARRSVSRLLSDQLNRLTDKINEVNIDLNLDSYQDYSTGSAQATTALELGISKTLFDDKLEVKVAGNVNLEGAEQEGLSDYVGDLILEYKITDDGRFRITGFRRSDFDVISGEIIETGAGIIYVRDYNSFKELFRKKNEN